MKNSKLKSNIMKSLFNSILVFFIFLIAVPAFAQINKEKTKRISKEFAVDLNSIVEIDHGDGLMDIQYYDGTEGKIEIDLSVKGNNAEVLEMLLSKYTIDVVESDGMVKIESSFNIKSWHSFSFFSFGKTKIKFKDGTEISSKLVTQANSAIKLWLPKISKLKLESNDDVTIGNLPFSLDIMMHSANLNIGDIDGDLKMDIKYSKANIGNVKDAKIEAYNSKVKMRNGNNINIDSKYSDIVFQEAKSLDLHIYDGKLGIEHVNESSDITGKYAKIKIGSIGKGHWDLYDCKARLGNGETLNTIAKYGHFEINEIVHLTLESHDVNFKIRKAGEIISDNDRYSKINIDLLTTSFSAKDTYDGKLNITAFGDAFTGIDFNGRHSQLNFPAPNGHPYQVNVDLKYGKVDYESLNLDIQQLKEKGSSFTLVAKTRQADENAPMLKVRGDDVDLDFK